MSKTLMAIEIEKYIENRAETKGSHSTIEKYDPNRWLGDASRRAKQLKIATHSAKFTHSASQGSSINIFDSDVQLAADTADGVVCSRCIRVDPSEIDIVGNAAAFDVANLLRLSDGTVSLLDQLAQGDYSALAPFANNDEQVREWAEGFLKVLRREEPSSDSLAKQLYVPVEEGVYHLLSPLQSSIISHRIYKKIAETYSEEAKDARKAKREEKPSNYPVIKYPGIARIKFGGTKPQNISLLNSERGGIGHFLNSSPPSWQSRTRLPLGVKSLFSSFIIEPYLQKMVFDLRDFLETYSDSKNNDERIQRGHNTKNTRTIRAEFVSRIIDEVLDHALTIQNVTDRSNWSTAPHCKINEAEKLWLDKGRALHDEDFNLERSKGEWRIEVASNFARWLNNLLKFKGAEFGDAEFSEWKKEMLKALNEVEKLSTENI
ncbi:MAG: type I-F CRISPR-associated protein Csy1 [Pseudobdellovibrionaceae bacterium]